MAGVAAAADTLAAALALGQDEFGFPVGRLRRLGVVVDRQVDLELVAELLDGGYAQCSSGRELLNSGSGRFGDNWGFVRSDFNGVYGERRGP